MLSEQWKKTFYGGPILMEPPFCLGTYESDLDKIYRIGKKVREYCEAVQKKYPELYTNALCGLCAKASGRLFKELKQEGINTKIVVSPYSSIYTRHVFLKYKHLVVDVTATQFGIGSKVLIEEHSFLLNHSFGEYWKTDKIFYDLESIYQYQIEDKWSVHQRITEV